jgi:Zn-dependent protease with chaperone function
MTALDAVRELLPPYVVWEPVLVGVSAAFAVSLLSAGLGAWIALRPLRRACDQTWAERACLAHPARVVARSNSLLLPALHGGVAFAVAPALLGLPTVFFAFLLALASYVGAAVVSFRVERIVRRGRYTFGQYLRAISAQWLLFHGPAFVLIALLLLMPATFNDRVWLLLGVGAAAMLLLAVGGGFYIVRILGMVKPASDRLQGIVSRTADSMGVPVRGVHELAIPVANALAFPFLSRLTYTPEILAVLDDDELAAVTAHELAHLSESPLTLVGRLVPAVLVVPVTAVRPLVNDFGPLILVGVFAIVVLGIALARRWSQRLERRADRVAKERQTQEGVYAQALGKIYESNLVPMVEPGKGASHPHLYDRLVAAGATPDFSRPRPPSRFRVLLGEVVTLLVLVAAWTGLTFARFSIAPRGADERAVLRSLALGGRSAVDLSDLAILRWRAGQLVDAAMVYQAAAEIDLDSPFLSANQAIVLVRLGRCGDADIAVREARRRHERNPQFRGEDIVRTAREAVLTCVEKGPALTR